jgi:predicted RNA-binding Zn-ribbon protein involved in translation (DUF1610 family)
VDEGRSSGNRKRFYAGILTIDLFRINDIGTLKRKKVSIFMIMKYYSDSKPEKCPECGSAKVADIIYGFPDVPTPEFREALDKGEIVLGGCVLDPDGGNARWRCVECGAEIF